MSKAIFRMASIDRLRAAVPFRGVLVDVVHSPMRGPDHEVTHRGTLVSVASSMGGHVIVLRTADHRLIDTLLPLSQVRSITAVSR